MPTIYALDVETRGLDTNKSLFEQMKFVYQGQVYYVQIPDKDSGQYYVFINGKKLHLKCDNGRNWIPCKQTGERIYDHNKLAEYIRNEA